MAGKIERGAIYWVELHDKKRPALVLTRQAVIPVLNHVTVVPATTTIRNIPTEVSCPEKDGLPEDCVLNCDHLVTVPKDTLKAKITSLDSSRLREVKASLLFGLGWDYTPDLE